MEEKNSGKQEVNDGKTSTILEKPIKESETYLFISQIRSVLTNALADNDNFNQKFIQDNLNTIKIDNISEDSKNLIDAVKNIFSNTSLKDESLDATIRNTLEKLPKIKISKTNTPEILPLLALNLTKTRGLSRPWLSPTTSMSESIRLLAALKELQGQIDDKSEKKFNILAGNVHTVPINIRVTKDSVDFYVFNSLTGEDDQYVVDFIANLERLAITHSSSIKFNLHFNQNPSLQKDGRSCGAYSLITMKAMERMSKETLETNMSEAVEKIDVGIIKYSQFPGQLESKNQSNDTTKEEQGKLQEYVTKFFSYRIEKDDQNQEIAVPFNNSILFRNLRYLQKASESLAKDEMFLKQAYRLNFLGEFIRDVIKVRENHSKLSKLERLFIDAKKNGLDLQNGTGLLQIIDNKEDNINIFGNLLQYAKDTKMPFTEISYFLKFLINQTEQIKTKISGEYNFQDFLYLNVLRKHAQGKDLRNADDKAISQIKEDLFKLHEGKASEAVLDLYISLVIENKLYLNIEKLNEFFASNNNNLAAVVLSKSLESIFEDKNKLHDLINENKNQASYVKLLKNETLFTSLSESLKNVKEYDQKGKLEFFEAILVNHDNSFLSSILSKNKIDIVKDVVKDLTKEQMVNLFSSKNAGALVDLLSNYYTYQKNGTAETKIQNIIGSPSAKIAQISSATEVFPQSTQQING